MIEALTTHHNRMISVIFLAACCISTIAASVIGIEDNVPGILCAFIAAAALILAFVHPWRTAKQFSLLLLAAVESNNVISSFFIPFSPLWTQKRPPQ